ncbi:MAG: alkaline phosphatase D family protein [SAR324 cluster bacterium]
MKGQSMAVTHDASGRWTRRAVLRLAAGAGAGLAAAPAWIHRVQGESRRWPQGDPFGLGVAAGSPAADGFVVWTRLAPAPLAPDPEQPGGMSGGPVPVAYEIATDTQFKQVVQRGTGTAEPAFAYSVHVEVKGLQPGRPYWYRFASGEAQSRAGRAVTLPAPEASPARLRFGFVSCANYELGYFSAYRHLADEQPDLVLFLGDYIYDYIAPAAVKVRQHSDGVEAATLPSYRNRYAQYRLDPDLQRLHAETTGLFTWDDHEVQNDYAGRYSQTFDDPATFLIRRTAAYRAFYEHQPLRPSLSLPKGPDLRLYERFAYGRLAEIFMLDERQYRSRQACYGPPHKGGGHLETDASCPELRDEARSMLGEAQEAWLSGGLARSQARWNVLAQGVMMAQLRQRLPDGSFAYWTDRWDGYPAARTRLLRLVHGRRVSNPVVLSGDLHSFWANDLKLDFDAPASPTVAAELVGSSITSSGPNYETFQRFLPDNPHVRFFDSRVRGYVAVDVSPERLTARFRAISDRRDPQATVATLRTFVVEDGRTGLAPG